MNFTLEILSIHCECPEGHCTDDNIKLFVTPVINGKEESINTGSWPTANSNSQVVVPSAHYYEAGKFTKGTKRTFSNIKSDLNHPSGMGFIYLVDDDLFDWDDILGYCSIQGYTTRLVWDVLTFDGHGSKYYVEYKFYPTVYDPNQAALQVSTMKHSMIGERRSSLVSSVMENEKVVILPAFSWAKVEETIFTQVTSGLYKEAQKLEKSIVKTGGQFTSDDLTVLLNDQLKNAEGVFTSKYLDENLKALDEVKLAIVYGHVRENLSLDKFGETFRKLIHPGKSNPALRNLPLSDEGRTNVCKKIALNLKRTILSKVESLIEEFKGNTETNLNEFDIHVKSEVNLEIQEITKELHRRTIDLAKLLMFQYPKQYLLPEVSSRMISLIHNMPEPSSSVGVFESSSDDAFYDVERGYGIRKSIYKSLKGRSIDSIEDFSARMIPSRGGKIPGLGKDIFFDLAMSAYDNP